MEIKLEIDSAERNLTYELFEGEKQLKLSDNAIVTYDRSMERAGFGFPELIVITVTIVSNIGINLFSSWLYDKLKDKQVKIKFNGKESDLHIQAIEKYISEKLQSKNE